MIWKGTYTKIILNIRDGKCQYFYTTRFYGTKILPEKCVNCDKKTVTKEHDKPPPTQILPQINYLDYILSQVIYPGYILPQVIHAG